MRALNHQTVVSSPLTEVFHHLAERLAGVSRDALTAEDIALSPAPERTGADLAFPCFPLARAWRKNPAQIAQEMAEALSGEDPILASVEAAGPYLNLRLHRSATANSLLAGLSLDYGDSERQNGEVVMMEYVSPNTNKPLHLGHVRNAVLGRCVANLVHSQGAAVHKSDIINDRGIHIAKSMMAYQRFGHGETPESTGEKGDHFVGRYYVEFDKVLRAERADFHAEKDLSEEDLKAMKDRDQKKVEEEFLATSPLMQDTRKMLQQWEAEDPDVRALWRKMNQWVYDGFEVTYKRLGIDFDKHYYESDIFQGGREMILEALERGVFTKADNGAVIAPLSQHGKLNDKVVLRADGTGLYITQDINLAQIKFKEFGLTKSYYCVGSEQNYYFQQLKATLQLIGFDWADGLEHLSYGMVYLPDGKMKSREGTVVDADDLMAEVTRLARLEIEMRLAEKDDSLDEAELSSRAEAIGLAALVFEMLKVGRETDIKFDPEKSVTFKGETGPYLQYVYARISSILRQAGDWQAPEQLSLEEDSSWALARGLLYYPTVVADAAEGLDPSRLTAFLIEQAQAFNVFYNQHRVLDAPEPERSSRLAVIQAFRQVLGHGLKLLSIESLEKM